MHCTLAKTNLNVAALLCALGALALYSLTLAPTFGWGDSADLALRMVYHGDGTFLNTSRDYALYRWVGGLFQLLPIGDAGTRANLMTAFFGATTVGLVAWLTGYVSRSLLAAYAAGVALAVSHTFWLMSVIAEVYTFNATLVFACYVGVALWWRNPDTARGYIALIAAAFFAGLALTHHATGLVLGATVAPLVLARIRRLPWWVIALAALVVIAAACSYWQRTALRLEADLPLLRAMGLQTPTNPFFDASPLHEFAKFIAYAVYNFFGFGALLAAWGLLVLWQKRCWEILPAALWLGLMVFAGITSSIPDKFNIYVLVYPVLAMAVGVGAARAHEKYLCSHSRAVALLVALAVVPPLGYAGSIHAAQRLGIDLVGARPMPYRDNDWYFMWPAKNGDVGPRRYGEEAFAALDKNAVLLADYSLWRPLYFLQHLEGVRPDVTLVWVEPVTWNGTVPDYIAALPCSKPVYLATDKPAEYYELDAIKKRYRVTQDGVVFRVAHGCRR